MTANIYILYRASRGKSFVLKPWHGSYSNWVGRDRANEIGFVARAARNRWHATFTDRIGRRTPDLIYRRTRQQAVAALVELL